MESRPAHQIIAIDGPAASGKSSVAQELARTARFRLRQLRRDVSRHDLARSRNTASPTDDAGAIEQLAERATIECQLRDHDSLMLINGVDAEPFLRENRVNDNVSLVSSVPRVREILVDHLRRYAGANDLVMEGRDIGSVVFPETPFKFYIDASPEIRARRRAAQGEAGPHRRARSG